MDTKTNITTALVQEARTLNEEQQKAVEYNNGPLLIIAGAGTGKTTVITEKIAHLLVRGHAQPENILAITFTEKAARELQERTDALLPYGYLDLQISTFHAFAQTVLEKHGLDIGLPHEFKLLDETAAWMLVRQNLKQFKLDYYRPLGNPTKFIHALLRHFSKCKDELVSPEDYLSYAENLRLNQDSAEFVGAEDKESASAIHTQEIKRVQEVADAFHTYNQLLLEHNALDLSDLIYYLIKLFKERQKLFAEYKKRFTHILVDEFQDTNWAQYELIKMLAGKNSALTVVGDDDQSIFRFRGASVSNILQFKKDFPNTQEVVLTKNYRSPQNILGMAYAVIQNNNPDRLEAKIDGLNKRLVAEHNREGDIAFICAPTGEEEVRRVAERIIDLQKQTGCPWSECAILVRANAHAEPFVAELRRRGVPVQFVAARGLYRQAVTLDALAFFRVIESYHESVSLYRMLEYPVWFLPLADKQELMYWSKRKNWSLWFMLEHNERWNLSEEGRAVCNTIVGLVKKYAGRAKVEKPSQLLYRFLEDTGYINFLAKKEAQGDAYWAEQIAFIRIFLEEIAHFEEESEAPTIKRVLEYYQFILESGDEGSLAGLAINTDAVQVLTTHKAKGLEFENVCVANLIEQRFPTQNRSEPIAIPDALVKELLPEGDPHMQEERRLFYVAITRAKKTLTLTAALHYGGVRARKLSRFLIEAGFQAPAQQEKPASKLSAMAHDYTPSSAQKKSDWKLPSIYSFSQFKTFSTCPLQYKYAHLIKIPVSGKPYFTFGQAIHKTLERLYQRIIELNIATQNDLFGFQATSAQTVRVPALEEMLLMYQEAWKDDWYRNEDEKKLYFEKGRSILKEYYEKQTQAGWRTPRALEQMFKVKIGSHVFSGRIDRIDSFEDGIEIVDYKTGQPKDSLTTEDKEQLFIYQLAAERVPALRMLGIPKKLTFYYLENNTAQSFLGTQAELGAFQEKIGEYMDNLKKSTFEAKPSVGVCAHCDFKEICPSRIL